MLILNIIRADNFFEGYINENFGFFVILLNGPAYREYVINLLLVDDASEWECQSLVLECPAVAVSDVVLRLL